MDKFLIYDTKEEALAKADEEGKAIGLPYHISSENTTRYAGEIIYTIPNSLLIIFFHILGISLSISFAISRIRAGSEFCCFT